MQWLERDFLNYLDDWEDNANSQADLSKSEQNRLCLSRETLEGLRMTGIASRVKCNVYNSFVQFTHLLSLQGISLTSLGYFTSSVKSYARIHWRVFLESRGCVVDTVTIRMHKLSWKALYPSECKDQWLWNLCVGTADVTRRTKGHCHVMIPQCPNAPDVGSETFLLLYFMPLCYLFQVLVSFSLTPF